MKILAFESSCDETAVAVVEDGRTILSDAIASQADLHALYGGVVPEIASRKHVEAIAALTEQALAEARCTRADIDAVAVTYAPGLIGALLVGVNYAKGLCLGSGKPLIPVHHIRRQDLIKNIFLDILVNLLLGYILIMLGGQNHCIQAHRLIILIILHCNLGLSVGTQVRQGSVLSHLGKASRQLVGQGDGQGHELLRLPAGVAEHHALVARAARVHTHGDIRALLVDVGDHGAGVGVKAVFGAGVADAGHHLPHQLLKVHIAAGGDLAHDVDQAGGHAGLAGHPGVGVLGQDLVQDGVRDLVADLVGMPLGDGFGCKKMSCHRCNYLP